MKIYVLLGEIGLYIFLQVLVRHLIAILKLPIIIRLFLYSVIGQMNKPIGQVIQGKLLAGGPYVAILIEVTFEVAVDGGKQSIAPNIKLSIADKQRPLNVFLDDMSVLHLGIACNLSLDLSHGITDEDS